MCCITECLVTRNGSSLAAVRLQNKVITTGKALVIFAVFLQNCVYVWKITDDWQQHLQTAKQSSFSCLPPCLFIGLPEMAFHNKSLSADKQNGVRDNVEGKPHCKQFILLYFFFCLWKNVKRFTSRMSPLIPLTKARKIIAQNRLGWHPSSISNIVSVTPTFPFYIIQLLESCFSAMALPSACAWPPAPCSQSSLTWQILLSLFLPPLSRDKSLFTPSIPSNYLGTMSQNQGTFFQVLTCSAWVRAWR